MSPNREVDKRRNTRFPRVSGDEPIIGPDTTKRI